MTYQEMTDLIKKYRVETCGYAFVNDSDIWCVVTGDFDASKIQSIIMTEFNYAVVDLDSIELDGTHFVVKFNAVDPDLGDLKDTIYLHPVAVY